jgi:GNAT superfamily N-acetyltransferase
MTELHFSRTIVTANQRIQLRAATATDAADIAALLTELGYQTSGSEVPPRLAAVLEEGGAVLLAVDTDDRSLGMMCLARYTVLHAPAPFAYITALVTAAAARRRGVGQLLVAAAKEWAREAGCVKLSGTSAEHRADAHAFYPACGLPYTGRRFTTAIAPRA